MPVRFAVVGPGRLGSALARRWVEAGLELEGFLARERGGAAAAIAFCGGGRELGGLEELREVELVLLSVSDAALSEVAGRAAAAGGVGGSSLWVHTSGVHGLDVLEPLAAAGARVGSLHPLVPVPDAETGHGALPGKPAVVQGEASVMAELEELARRAGMEPVRMASTERALYHAACALAANGATALFDQVRELFVAAGVDEAHADRLGLALFEGALAACAARGVPGALSGPVRRGDTEVVRSHLRALAGDRSARTIYSALMRRALGMTRRAGDLSAEAASSLDALLGESDG